MEQAIRNCISGDNNVMGIGTALIADAKAAGLPEQSEEISEGALIFWMGWNNALSGERAYPLRISLFFLCSGRIAIKM